MNSGDARLRGYLQRLFETQAAALWEHIPDQKAGIIQVLLDTLLDERYSQSKPPLAPNQYVLELPQRQGDALRQNIHLLDTLAIAIHKAGKDIGRLFPVLPRVLLNTPGHLPEGTFKLETAFWEPAHLKAAPLKEGLNIPPQSAYFIINGTQVFYLERPLIHIGRRPDNDLVLDDPRVSRLHAQLRALQGRFMLFDLKSTGGTYVNNVSVDSTVLYPGDVVLLAGTTMVYGQRSTRPLQGPAYQAQKPHVVNLSTTMTFEKPSRDTSGE